MTEATRRPKRADAQRNRERLIAVARDAFVATDTATSLEAVARAAGVGIGTLYRHFPTREALVDAVYAAELDDVTGCAPELLRIHPADVALRGWMDRYAAFVTTKRGMLDTLRSGWAAGTIATPDTRARITQVLADFLESGATQRVLRDDVPAEDVTTALVGIFLSTATVGNPAQVERLLDLLVAGLRP
ncbi:TetR family transcriptional regulator [Antricoccus suffuscus]|uniref:TetR family transcriptional regulator n=1 Tax=Antricoccus suffuscus TaxID=1629062 RepID=A0A2T0ZXZ2_9ACTN|nr:TetR/AcrR family transcriptional regulator [Antricoccus suffuscus]PRZ41203.1 TetR family transcriptional regulator [Antricoccus suffuscus]